MNPLKYTPAQVRKVSAAAITFAANLVAAGVLTGTTALTVMAFISAAGVFGVFALKNEAA